MKVASVFFRIAFITLLVQCVTAQHIHQDIPPPDESKSENTYLLDEFGKLGHCDFTARFDNMFAELSNLVAAQGYIIFYKGKDVLPGRYEESSHQRLFSQHLAFRNFDPSRITIVDGGFRDEIQTEIWIVPGGGETPTPSKTVSAPTIPVDKTFLFDSRYVLLDDTGELLREFELPSVAERRAEEESAAEAEYQKELESQESPEPEGSSEPEPASEAENEEEPTDTRTAEEIEAEKFDWTSQKFGGLLASRKEGTGVIIFYADDQTFDIVQLKQFIEQGRTRIAEAAGIAIGRMSIEFGGYRDTPEVEFWFVPAKGKAPVATPNERPAEEPEEAGESGT